MSELTKRTETRTVMCGNVPIGGGAPVSIQSMTNTRTEDMDTTSAQVIALANAGADIVRIAVPTAEAATSFGEIKKKVRDNGHTTPLVADIHFDYKLALAAIKAGADKIRINPGNIGGEDRIKAVADAAGEAGIPIRIGVNAGSLEKDLAGLYAEGPAEALAMSALRNIDLISSMGFEDMVVSIKSADVIVNTEAHMILARATDFPLHIGITEAGYGEAAIVKSAAGIGALLAMGLGDTIRVSLTGDPLKEIPVARDILRSVNLLPGSITLISCPTCGRCKSGLASLSKELSVGLAEIEAKRIHDSRQGKDIPPLTVALMGCAVNGPGEASQADLGVAMGADIGIYFEKGVKGDSIPYDRIVSAILDRVRHI